MGDLQESRKGLYTLSSREIYDEAKELFKVFFVEQTPLNAFKLSIILYHLLEWIEPSSQPRSSRDVNEIVSTIRSKAVAANDAPSLDSKIKLIRELWSYEFYDVLRSVADNSKHFCLTRSKPYEKSSVKGFIAGRSVAGEKIDQENLVILFDTENPETKKEIWLREVFGYVLGKYAEYFGDEGIYPDEI